MVGGYAEGDHASKYYENLERDIPDNVEMRGAVSEEELIDLYARCKRFNYALRWMRYFG